MDFNVMVITSVCSRDGRCHGELWRGWGGSDHQTESWLRNTQKIHEMRQMFCINSLTKFLQAQSTRNTLHTTSVNLW